MSLSLNKITDWCIVLAILLAIVVGVILAVWQGGIVPTNLTARLGRHPSFDFNFPLSSRPSAATQTTARNSGKMEDPFWHNKPVQTEPEDLNLRELVLGLVVVTNTERYCLSNGIMMSEGQKSGRFAVTTITEEGVWYTSRSDHFFLRVGERVSIDYDGKVHAVESRKSTNKEAYPEKTDTDDNGSV